MIDFRLHDVRVANVVEWVANGMINENAAVRYINDKATINMFVDVATIRQLVREYLS